MTSQKVWNNDAKPCEISSSAILNLLLVSLLILFIFPAMSFAAGGDSEWDRLIGKAQDAGSVRVIVQMTTDSAMDEDLSTASGQANRQAAMERLHERLLNSPAIKGLNVSSLKAFSFIPFIALEADAAALQGLRNDPNVAGIEEDKIDFPVLMDSVPLIGADQTAQQGFSGAGQAVVILDTGVDKFHSFFGGRVVSEACYSHTNLTFPIFASISVCPDRAEGTTEPGSGVNCDANDTEPFITRSCDHGTHVAGIAAGDDGPGFTGVAPQADIIAIQVFSKFIEEDFCGTASNTPCIASFTVNQIQGLERVLELSATMDIASINMSLGGGSYSSNCDDTETARKAIIDNLRSVGIATVIASGNNASSDKISGPACISSAVSVGSTTKSDTISSFSNRASFLSLMAPGSSIESSVPNEGFGFKSGTSMATPHTAGAWAVLKQSKPTASVTEILTALQNTGEPIFDSRSGLTFPRIQVDAALAELGGGGNPTPADKPTADAGPDQSVTDDSSTGSAQVTLDGSGSSDPNGKTLTFTWTLPDNSTVNGMNPTVTLPVGSNNVTLVVNNGSMDSNSDTVNISVTQSDSGSGSIDISPNKGLNITGSVGGPFDKTITYTVSNTGGSGTTISFTITKSDPWIAVTDLTTGVSLTTGSMNGTLASGDSVDIHVAADEDDAGGLKKGKYNGTVTITNDSTGETETRSIQLQIKR